MALFWRDSEGALFGRWEWRRKRWPSEVRAPPAALPQAMHESPLPDRRQQRAADPRAYGRTRYIVRYIVRAAQSTAEVRRVWRGVALMADSSEALVMMRPLRLARSRVLALAMRTLPVVLAMLQLMLHVMNALHVEVLRMLGVASVGA